MKTNQKKEIISKTAKTCKNFNTAFRKFEQIKIKLQSLGTKIVDLFNVPIVSCWSFDYKGSLPSGNYYVVFWQKLEYPEEVDHLETDPNNFAETILVFKDGTRITHTEAKDTNLKWDAIQADNPIWLACEILSHLTPHCHLDNLLEAEGYATTTRQHHISSF